MSSAPKFRDLEWANGMLDVDGPAKAVLVEAERIFGQRHRDWQACAIECLVRKEDLFIKAGTGSGKSLVFQSMIAARPNGIVLVIVPLKTLMDDQIERLEKLGVPAVALTRETVRADSEIWSRLDGGAYRVVYASPEILFHNASHFLKRTLPSKNAFKDRLTLISIDEAHSIYQNGEFRPEFNKLGDIRDYLPKVPICAMSATLPPHVMTVAQNVLDMPCPTNLITVRGRKNNLDLLVRSQPSRTKVNALDHLIPETLQSVCDIPKTLIFADSVIKALQITVRLRNVLSAIMPDSRPIRTIRPYYSSIDAKKKKETRHMLENGESRIVVCTDSMSLGIDIRDIERVIQWGVTEKLDPNILWQRFGRAARDPEIQGLGVVYVPADLLEPVRKYMMKDWEHGIPHNTFKDMDGWEDEPNLENDGHDSNNEGAIPRFQDRRLELFSLPVTPGTDWEVRRLRAHMYRKAKEFRRIRQEAKEERRRHKVPKSRVKISRHNRRPVDLIDPALLWFLNTVGCRHRCILSYLKYPDIFDDTAQKSWCCDNCAIQTDLDLAILSTAGMSPSDGIHAPPGADTPVTSHAKRQQVVPAPPPRRVVVSQVFPNLVRDLKAWRNVLHGKLIERKVLFPGSPAQLVLPNLLMDKLGKRIREIHSVDDVRTGLVNIGFDLESGILRDKDIADIFTVLDDRATAEAATSEAPPNAASTSGTLPPGRRPRTDTRTVSELPASRTNLENTAGDRDNVVSAPSSDSTIKPPTEKSHLPTRARSNDVRPPQVPPREIPTSLNPSVTDQPARDLPTPYISDDLRPCDEVPETLGGRNHPAEVSESPQSHAGERDKENTYPGSTLIRQQRKRKRSTGALLEVVSQTNKTREKSHKRLIRPTFKLID